MPMKNDSPVEYSHSLWNQFTLHTDRKARSIKGQFVTPPSIARFMASLADFGSKTSSILDAGAGTGILTAALAERFVDYKGSRTLNIHLYENDDSLYPLLQDSMDYLQNWLQDRGVPSEISIITDDFVLENGSYFNTQQSLFQEEQPRFDITVMNPPYFKLNKADKRSRAASRIVHGQPNIYAIFMMLGALMLNDTGTLISISPRSFASGLYFKSFRDAFFKVVHPSSIHLFTSRTTPFKSADVLQETTIMKATRSPQSEMTRITSSMGSEDLDSLSSIEVPTKSILRKYDGQVLFIPLTKLDLEVMNNIESWPETMATLGLRVSTGPVVPFRATDFLKDKLVKSKTVPLIWMQNVRQMKVIWPKEISKPQYITRSTGSKKLLLPVSPYVLLHRFSAKEQKRRFIAAPMNPDEFDFDMIGVENHINYIHRPAESLPFTECVGIAAILCTTLLDNYIRIRSGSTQVNASDMKSLPMPTRDSIIRIGKKLETKSNQLEHIESVVLSELGLNDLLD